MRRSRSRSLLLVLGMAALALTPLAWSHEPGKPPRRVPAAEVLQWVSDDSAVAGFNHRNHCVFLNTGPLTRRIQYYSCPDGASGTIIGSIRIKGDTVCAIFEDLKDSSGCYEWHEIGENKFQMRINGILRHTVYRLR